MSYLEVYCLISWALGFLVAFFRADNESTGIVDFGITFMLLSLISLVTPLVLPFILLRCLIRREIKL